MTDPSAGAAAALRVRTARMDDARALARLAEELGYPGCAEHMQRNLGDLLCAGSHALFVAAGEHAPASGFIHVFVALRLTAAPFGEIGGFVVTAPQRGQGIGRLLLRHAEHWLRSQGVRAVRVRTRATRVEATAIYARLGFAPTKLQQVLDKPLAASI